MDDLCERCRREVWRATHPQHFDAALHCLAHSGAKHQVDDCENLERQLLRAEVPELRRLLAESQVRHVKLARAANHYLAALDSLGATIHGREQMQKASAIERELNALIGLALAGETESEPDTAAAPPRDRLDYALEAINRSAKYSAESVPGSALDELRIGLRQVINHLRKAPR